LPYRAPFLCARARACVLTHHRTAAPLLSHPSPSITSKALICAHSRWIAVHVVCGQPNNKLYICPSTPYAAHYAGACNGVLATSLLNPTIRTHGLYW
jgi:hypothetical protein